jgi:hypothetical protein
MRWKLPVTAACAILAAAIAIPADAAPRKRAPIRYVNAPQTVFVDRDESGRSRTRIIVQRRSFLDGGTEVLPGQRKFTDYVNPPGYRASDVTGRTMDRGPMNGPFDYGYRNW